MTGDELEKTLWNGGNCTEVYGHWPINSISRQGKSWSETLKAGKSVGHAEGREQRSLRREHGGGVVGRGLGRLLIQDWSKKGDVVHVRSQHVAPSCLVGEKQL